MKKVWFTLDKVPDEATGQEVDTLVKHVKDGEQAETQEPWGSVIDFNQLFDACVKRWGSNWDINKVTTAIIESEID